MGSWRSGGGRGWTDDILPAGDVAARLAGRLDSWVEMWLDAQLVEWWAERLDEYMCCWKDAWLGG